MTNRRKIKSIISDSVRISLNLGMALGFLSATAAYAGNNAQPPPDLKMLQAQALAGQTIPFWTGTVTSPLDNKTYTYTMVGKDPNQATPNSNSHTHIDVQPILLTINSPDGKSLSPDDPIACTRTGHADTISAYQRLANSPLFNRTRITSNGQWVADGMSGIQLLNAFQRSQFWPKVKGTNYGVSLGLLAPKRVSKTLSEPSVVFDAQTTLCNQIKYMASIDYNYFDNIAQTLVKQYAKPNQLTIIVTRNLYLSANVENFNAYYYHNSIATPSGTYTYAFATIKDSQTTVDATDDIALWNSALADWMDDPFNHTATHDNVSVNLTPAWKPVWSKSDCRTALAVGEPLDEKQFPLELDNFTYHVVDLAFVDWFYGTPSRGTGGAYSFLGRLKGGKTPPRTLCK